MAAKRKTSGRNNRKPSPGGVKKTVGVDAKPDARPSRGDVMKGLESRLKSVDRELLEIERAISEHSDSKVVDEDFRGVERFWRMKTELVKVKGKAYAEKKFYRNFVLRCTKCMEEFGHRAGVGPATNEFKCPVCGRDHRVTITPTSKYFRIDFPDSVEVVESEE